MRIGILEAGYPAAEVREKLGNFDAIFAKFLAGQGFDFAGYRVVDMEFPATVDECDGWIITGSKHGAYEALAFIKPLEQFILDAYAAGVPIVGICFGHQLMAQAFGGRVKKADEGWLVGRQEYDLEGRQKIHLNAWHQDQVCEKPKDVTTIASNPTCRYAGFLYGDRGMSFQAHPEFDDAFIADYLDIRGEDPELGMPKERVEAARAQLEEAVDRELIAEKIATFFRRGVKNGAKNGAKKTRTL